MDSGQRGRTADGITRTCVGPSAGGLEDAERSETDAQETERLLSQLAKAAPRYRFFIQNQLAEDLRRRLDADDIFADGLLALLRAVQRQRVTLYGLPGAHALLKRFVDRAVAHAVDRARRKRRDYRREDRAEGDRHAGRGATPEQVALVMDTFDSIAARLGPASAAIFAYHVQQLSERDIARRLGIRRGRVQWMLGRIRETAGRAFGCAAA